MHQVKLDAKEITYEKKSDIEKRLEKLKLFENFTPTGKEYVLKHLRRRLESIDVHIRTEGWRTFKAKVYHLPKRTYDHVLGKLFEKINSSIKEITIKVIDEKTKKPVKNAIVDVKYLGPSRENLLRRYFKEVNDNLLEKVEHYDLKAKETNKDGEVSFKAYVPCKLRVDVIDWDYWFKRAKVEFEPGKLERTIDVTRIPK